MVRRVLGAQRGVADLLMKCFAGSAHLGGSSDDVDVAVRPTMGWFLQASLSQIPKE